MDYNSSKYIPTVYGQISSVTCKYCGHRINFGVYNDNCEYGIELLEKHQDVKGCKVEHRDKRLNELLNN